MLDSFVTRLYTALSRRRWLTLACAGILVLVSAALLSGIRLEQDFRMMLPRDDEVIGPYYDSLSKFRPMDRLYIDVSVSEADPRVLVGAADALYEKLASMPDLRGVTYEIDPGGARKMFDLIASRAPNLFSEEDARALPPLLEKDRIQERLAWFKRNLDGPQGAFLKEGVRRDPVGVTDRMMSRLAPLQAGFGGARLEDGRITSRDGRHVLLVAETAFPPTDAERSAAFVKEVADAARGIEADYPVRVAFTGTHRSSTDNVTLIRQDITRTTIIAIAACLVLTLLFLRRWWLGIFAIVPVVAGGGVAGAALALGCDRVSVIAVGCGAALIGIALDYGIHVLFHLDVTGPVDRDQEAKRVGFLSTPIAIGVLTAIGAFLLLLLSPIPGYRQVGVFSAVAVFAAAVFALLILPLVLPRSRRRANPIARAAVRTGELFFAWHRNHRGLLLVGSLALTAAAVIGIGRVAFEGNPQKLNGMSPEAKSDEALLRETWGDAMALTLVVTEASNPDAALHRDGLVAGVLEDLHERGVVTSFSSVSAVCPSREVQAVNVRRWKDFWSAERRAQVRQRLTEAAAELEFRAGVFDAWFKSLEAEPPPLVPGDFAATPLREVMDARVAGNAVSAVVKLQNRGDAGRLRDAVRAVVPEAVVVDAKALADRITELAKEGMTRYALMAGAVVVVILLLIYGRPALAAVSILPLVVVLVWTFGTLGLLGIPLNMASSVFVVFLIGVGIDCSQFLIAERLARFRGEPGHPGDTAASVALCAITTLFGFGALALARHPVLFSIGITTSLGMAYTLIAIPVFTPLAADLVLYRDRTGGAPRLVDFLNFFIATFCLVVAQTLLLFPVGPVLMVVTLKSPEKRRALLRRLSHGANRLLFAFFPRSKLIYEGIAPEIFRPGAIVVSNHQSNLDPLLVLSINADILLTIKRRWWNSIIIGTAVRWMGHIRVDEESPRETMERCRAALEGGSCVHFFPEGTRSTDGRFIKFRRGAFRLASELKRDILPLLFCDSRDCIPPGGWWVEEGCVRIKALPRITPGPEEEARDLMKRVESTMREAFRELLNQNNTPKVLRKKVGRLYRYQGTMVENYIFWKQRRDPLFGVIGETVPRQGRIVDVGCGYGNVAHWLLQHGPDRTILGVDYDDRKIRAACSTSRGDERIAFERRDILEWTPPPADAFLLLDVLHYLSPDRQRRLLETLRGVLQPGGRLVIRDMFRDDSVGHRRNLFWERFAIRFGFNKGADGVHVASLEEMRGWLKEAGFARIEEIPGGGKGTNRLLTAFPE